MIKQVCDNRFIECINEIMGRRESTSRRRLRGTEKGAWEGYHFFNRLGVCEFVVSSVSWLYDGALVAYDSYANESRRGSLFVHPVHAV